MNEDDVDGGVTKGKPGGVSDDSEELEAVTTLPLDCATQGTERDVERDDLGSSLGEELRVHSRAGTDHESRGPAKVDASDGPAELLLQ